MQIMLGAPRAAREFKGHVTAFCEVAQMLTDRFGLPTSMQGLFAYLVERWDGRGLPGRARHQEIPLPVRIASVARDATFQRMLGGPEFAAGVVRKRAGGAFDPDVATPLADAAGNGSGCTPTIPSASWPALRSWPRWHPWPASTTSGSTARATTEEPPPPTPTTR